VEENDAEKTWGGTDTIGQGSQVSALIVLGAVKKYTDRGNNAPKNSTGREINRVKLDTRTFKEVKRGTKHSIEPSKKDR